MMKRLKTIVIVGMLISISFTIFASNNSIADYNPDNGKDLYFQYDPLEMKQVVAIMNTNTQVVLKPMTHI